MRTHVDGFFNALFPSSPRGGLSLAQSFWDTQQLVSDSENTALTAPFSEDEVWAAIKGMNPASAPRPDTLPVKFFHTFWDVIKSEMMALFDEFYVVYIDLSCLNFGNITLIRKVSGASNIHQFRPIMVINEIFPILAKGYANRVTQLAHHITHPNQSSFIQGRFILDGVLVFHEFLQEDSIEIALLDLGRLAFRRPFGLPQLVAWDEMLQCIALHSPDVDIAPSLCLEPSGHFSTRSLYRAIAPSSASKALTDVWGISSGRSLAAPPTETPSTTSLPNFM
ncbi:Signal recognition particle 54 kDa protein, chloroplastic [Hordeum vulgare]|nr:Signal recognition particle 54 kDa protein, chloroplastic [Hordeum vulgare]